MKRPYRSGGRSFWIVAECLVATALALFLALRLQLGSVWLLVPLLLIVARREALDDYALELRLTPPSLGAHLAIGAAALVVYTLAHVAFARLAGGRPLAVHYVRSPAVEFARQFLAVAVPEEFFFRGYLQTNLDRAFPKRWTIWGARCGPALVLQSALFAGCHLVTGDWTRLGVFFFGVLAGWLRERSGSILPSATYHAVANLWYAVLVG